MTTTIREAKTDMHEESRRPLGGRAAAVLTAGLFVTLAGCEVTNPGPVADEGLNETTVHQALVNGAGRRLSQSISFIGYTGALPAREIIAGGQTGNGGHDATTQAGSLLQTSNGNHWTNAHQSRWIAEDAIRRFSALPAAQVDAGVFTEAYLWAGYANRLLGENYCDAVFDGGAREANSKYFERAEKHFTDAIAKAPATAAGANFKNAAYAGRASVRLWLKNYDGALADANLVAPAFVAFNVNADQAAEETRNQIYFSSSNTPYRGFSVFRTFQQIYYDETGDPRVPYGKDAVITFANSQLSGYGPIPWWYQLKYKTNNDDFRVSSQREMTLIKAEVALVKNDLNTAMTLINSLRTGLRSDKTGLPLAPWTAATIAEGWTFLKRERGIELWLEARRLGDLRRWAENKTPGAVDYPRFEELKKPDGSDGGSLFRNNPPSACFPIPQGELDTNPNF